MHTIQMNRIGSWASLYVARIEPNAIQSGLFTLDTKIISLKVTHGLLIILIDIGHKYVFFTV